MNKQQFFTQTIAKLIAQGGPAWDDSIKACKYRAGTRKCAIGLWIPDEEYAAHPEEAISASEAVQSDYWPTITKLADSVGIGLMNDLQYAHDMAANDGKSDAEWFTDFVGRAKKVADKHELKMETANG